MTAVINPRPTSTAVTSLGESVKLGIYIFKLQIIDVTILLLSELVQKVEGQSCRITSIHLFDGSEEGFVIASEDKTMKVLLKRDSGQFWPSTIQDLPSVPTKMVCDESTSWSDIIFNILYIVIY